MPYFWIVFGDGPHGVALGAAVIRAESSEAALQKLLASEHLPVAPSGGMRALTVECDEADLPEPALRDRVLSMDEAREAKRQVDARNLN